VIWTYAYSCLIGFLLWGASCLARYWTRPQVVIRFSDSYLCTRVDKDAEWHVLEETKHIPVGDGAVYGQKEAANDGFLYAGTHDTTPTTHKRLTS